MMEIKFIIIYLLFAIVIFVLIKEFMALKNTVKENNDKLKLLAYSSSKNIENKMRDNFTSCIDEIKLLNSNYLVQIRRMNDYEKDNIITTNSNNYTDSETIAKNKNNKILYLSDGFDANENRQDFKIKYSDVSPSKIIKDGPISEIDIEAELIKIDDNKKNSNSSCSDTTSEENEENEDSLENKESLEKRENEKSHDSIVSFNELNNDDVENMIIYNNLLENDQKSNSTSQSAKIISLLPIDKYNKKTLETIAKQFNIPTSYKDGEKRRVTQKEILYEKIKEKMMHK